MRFKIIVATGLTILLGSAYADPMIAPNTMLYGSTPEEGLQFALDESLSSNSNVFSLPSGVNPSGSSTRSSMINTQQADLQYYKPYGLQNFTLDANFLHNTFSNFSYLNYDATNYKGVWSGSIDRDFSVTVGAAQTQTLANYAYIQTYTKNIYTTKSRYINGNWWVTGPWHAIFGISQNQASYSSAQVLVIQGSKYNSANAGLSYVSEANNTITLKTQTLHGTYIGMPLNYANLIDNGYSEQDVIMDVSWALSGKSTLTGELKHVSISQDHFSQRDYGGLGGNVDYQWALTGNSAINFTAQRSFSQYLTSYSSYNVMDDFAISPVWQASPKLTLNLTLDRKVFNYAGYSTGSPFAQHDAMQTEVVGASWTVTRKIALSTSLQHISRNSNVYYYQFAGTSLNVVAQISF